jgi:hypothetical protein
MHVRADTESNRAAESSKSALAWVDKLMKKYGGDSETATAQNEAKRGKLANVIKAVDKEAAKPRKNAVDEDSFKEAATVLFDRRKAVYKALEDRGAPSYVAALRSVATISSVAASRGVDERQFHDWFMRNQASLPGYVETPPTAMDVAYAEWVKRFEALDRASQTRASKGYITKLRNEASFTRIAKEYEVDVSYITKNFPRRHAAAQR